MNRYKLTMIVVAAALLMFCAASIHALEAYDHPQIGRYEGSSIIHQESSSFDRYRVGLSAAEDGTVADTLAVEGKVLMTLYSGPEEASAFEVFSAYRKLLQSKQFEILFSCEKSTCGGQFLGAFYDLAPFANDPGWNNSAPITQGNPDASFVLAAKSESEEKTTYVSLIVSQGWWSYPAYKLDVVEVQEFEGKISSLAGPGEETGDVGQAPGQAREAVRRPIRFGVQLASDSYFGLLLYANRFEICAKVQAKLYDYPNGNHDDGVVMAGGHASYLFKLFDNIDLGVGVDMRQGIVFDLADPAYDYVQYMDGGPRLSLNYNLGEHLLVSGVLYPAWIVVRETEENDSFQLDAKIPSAAVAASFLF
jgi:hypothetical protein